MKSNYNGIRGWLNYVRDYKDNKDILGENLKEKELNDKITQLENINKEQSDLLALRSKTIDVLNDELTQQKKRNNELRKTLEKQCDVSNDLEAIINKKELERRKNAGAIGGLKKKINELNYELEKAKHKINFLEKSKHAPSKEEIIAYETRMKEVEKKLKKNVD